MAVIEQRNHFKIGDTVEFFGVGYKHFTQIIQEMYDKNDQPIDKALNAQMIVKVKVEQEVFPYDLMRKESI